MKISLALAALILLVGIALGLRDRQRLSSLRADRETLTAEAGELGVFIDPSDPAAGPNYTKRPRNDRDEETRRFAAEIIAFMKEEQQAKKSGGRPDPEFQKRAMGMAESLMNLSPSQLKTLIAEIKNAEGIDDEMRQGFVGFSIMMLAEDSPQSALALFTESSDLLGESRMSGHVISSALSRWSQDDPMAALEWVRKNAEKHPDIVTDEAKRGIIDGAAKQDPKLAFQLLGELGLKDPSGAVLVIVRSARTPEARTATLDAMRGHLATLPDGEEREKLRKGVLGSLLNTMRQEDFETSATWLAGAKLAPEESAAFAAGMHYHNTRENSGEWIAWMADELPAEQVEGRVRNIVGQWTREDYRAAGTWLAQAPDDAAKAPAVRAYAETVAAYEPQTAEQWALTLPPGEDRKATLESIHNRWPVEDTEARAAFARRYGIK